MKKRILAALLALCLVMLCACSGDDTSSTSSAAGESSTATESSEAGETSETGETSDVAETPTELPFAPIIHRADRGCQPVPHPRRLQRDPDSDGLRRGIRYPHHLPEHPRFYVATQLS